jgi:branched-chain amino acid transport system permease protein
VTSFLDILLGGVFHAAVLFLVAAGLQLVFGVQKIINLACGSFYALGAYTGISAVTWALAHGLPRGLFLFALIGAGLGLTVIGPPVEALLRTVYRRDEAFQLLLTFALVLIIEDILRMIWGANPQELGNLYMDYGTVGKGALTVPTYNLLVIAAALLVAIGLGLFLKRTRFGRLLRATAEDRETSATLGIEVGRVYTVVFTLGTVLGTLGGALVVPTAAASLDMSVDLVVEAFAVVVIGGLGSIRGAVVGALTVGLMRAFAVSFVPEMEMLSIYLVVIAVLIFRPAGLFGKAAA